MVFEQGVVFARMAIACVVCVVGMLFGRQVSRILAGIHLQNLRREAPFPWLEVHKNASNAALIPLRRVHDILGFVYPCAPDSMDVSQCRPLSIVTICENIFAV